MVHRLLSIAFMLIVFWIPSASRADEHGVDPPGICEIRNPGSARCNGSGTNPGGGGSGGEDEEDLGDFAWGAVEPLDTVCGSDPARPQYLQRLVWASGPNAGDFVTPDDFGVAVGTGDQVPGGPPGVVFAADGFVYRWVCSSLDIGADVWAATQERMADASVDTSPSVAGLTGLETWTWFGGDPTVQPFQLVWTDPATAFTWTLEAWAWTGELSWDFGDGEVHVESADGLVAAVAAAGTQADPAAAHTYRTTSTDAGFGGGYPFAFSATWVGEYRWSSDGGLSWSPTVPMIGSFNDTATVDYEVLQIRSTLVTGDA